MHLTSLSPFLEYRSRHINCKDSSHLLRKKKNYSFLRQPTQDGTQVTLEGLEDDALDLGD